MSNSTVGILNQFRNDWQTNGAEYFRKNGRKWATKKRGNGTRREKGSNQRGAGGNVENERHVDGFTRDFKDHQIWWRFLGASLITFGGLVHAKIFAQ